MGMIGELTYSYAPADWDQDRFLALGGFTVVFLNYNKARFVEKSVAGALNQDFPLLEMFFMDDASSDGSGDTMEKLVRQYRGRHKVTVVRNDVNQYITGQWNIVSKLVTGNWLGMFCGDDIAHSDRVSLVAKRIAKYPTLRGISTAAVDIDGATCDILPDSHYVPQPYLAFGTDAWEQLDANFRSNGSTSFWHKSLFFEPLPRVPLDDNYLHFRVFVLNKGVDGPIFFYDSSIKTIDYSLGVGVCGGAIQISKTATPRQKWVGDIKRYKRFLSKLVITMTEALRFAHRKGVSMDDLASFRCSLLWARIVSSSTLGRIVMIPNIFYALFLKGIPTKRKCSLVKAWAYFLVFEFFGLEGASMIRSMKKSRNA